MSRDDRRVLVYRNGVEIGRSKLAIDQPKQPFGTHAFIMQEGLGIGTSPILKSAPAHRWLAVGIPGHTSEHGQALNPAHAGRIQMPPNFAKALYEILAPGTTLLVTDAPILEQQTTGVALNIMNLDQPEPTDSKHRYLHAL
jgi:hypothetical protein